MALPLNIKISKYFSLPEMCACDGRLDAGNVPGTQEIVNLTLLCTRVLDPLCEEMGKVTIVSGYRSPQLNKLVGGVGNSQHVEGQAADILVEDVDHGRKMFDWLRTHVDYDRLCWERYAEDTMCIHVSYGKTLNIEN